MVRELSTALVGGGAPVSILTRERDAVPTLAGVEVATVRSIPAFARAVYGSHGVRVVAVHGFWAPSLVAASAAALAARRPLLLSPHGMFSSYSFAMRGRRKRLLLALGGRHILRRTTAFHATCEAEAKEIRALGLTQPIHIVPNGVHLPPLPLPPKSVHGLRTLLFMSRIHPKKGLFLLLDAFAPLAAARKEWRLVIAGPDENGHAAEVAARASQLGLAITFPGLLEGEAKARALAEADLFVLPTHNENFGLVIAEALAAGTPVLTTTGTPWQSLSQCGAGWWVPREREALAAALEEATALPPETLAAMGARGRRLVAENFSWDSVAAHYAAALEATVRAAAGREH
ncbi:glycosyltransferase [Acuticoccus sp. I52.16.1]|nr:glycosyltransferase [Acuticoccus sp. I52.16.1]